MAKRWVTEEELHAMHNQYAEGGDVQQENPLMEFFNQLPPELQQKIQTLPPEKQQEVLMQLMQKYQEQQQAPEQQQFEEGGETEGIPVEAEKNENVTVQDGQQPEVEGGYLQEQSHNPVTGQFTYEIPDNEHNNSHGETGNGSQQEGVNMELSEGDVINSNKTKIPVDFKIYGKNFKGKTFKDASDYLSKKETKVQEDFEERTKEGKIDKVSEGALQIMLTKLGKERNELNELQEQVLESKKQKEHSTLMNEQVAKYGKIVLEINKAKEGLNVTMDRYLNYMDKGGNVKKVLKAQDYVTSSLQKSNNFFDYISSNPKASLQDIKASYRQSGLGSINPSDNTSIYKPTFNPINGSQVVGDFKAKIAQRETGGYRNPYIAVSGISEKEASIKSFKELQSKAASSAIGKYQFVWNIHKNDIARVTGVKDPDAFRHNPQAQEAFMDWFRDTKLLPQATELKQRYQLPMSIDQIMAMTHLEGKAGLEKKIKSGTLSASTMASNSFQNASPLNYASKFLDGGKIYAGGGFNKSKGHFNEQNWNDLNKQSKEYFKRTFETPGDYQDYSLNNDIYREIVANMFNKGYWDNTNQGKSAPEAVKPYAFEIPEGQDKQEWIKNSPLYHAFRDNDFMFRGAIPQVKSFKNLEEFNTWKKDKEQLGDKNFYFEADKNNPVKGQWYSPDIAESYYGTPQAQTTGLASSNLDDLNRNKRNAIPINSGQEVDGLGDKTGEVANKKSSWQNRLNYGMRESLPYLRNLMLLNEDTINPVLRQKAYHNPYDNFNTDINIQSALNDVDRNTLTAMADERGNPSVRNARMAQLFSNAIAAKAPLYTQKYNTENQLKTQQQVGQSQYLNQFEDTNRALGKEFEREVLQTREVQRQQQNAAIDSMMNTYLRKAEQDQALKLSLMNTNWDWDKFRQELVNNPEKARAEFMRQQYIAKNSPTKNNYSMSSDYYIDNKGIPRKNPSKETEDNKGKYGLKVSNY